ncbi:MAG: hypothetical protein ABI197_09095 [Granulicella sp.]
MLSPNDNIAPTTFQPVIRANAGTRERKLTVIYWTLVPHRSKTINEFKK